MRVIYMLLFRAVRIGVPVLVCILLARELGAWGALGIWAGGMALVCAATAAMLRRAPAEKVTWVNRMAGFVLPWGYYIGRGKLPRIAMFSWLGWVALGAAVVTLTSLNVDSPPPPEAAAMPEAGASGEANEAWATVLRVLLLIAWLVDGAALMLIVGNQARYRMPLKSSVMTIVAILAGLIAVSAALAFFGGSIWTLLAAVIVAGGPPAMVGLFYGFFILVVLVFGRNTRWN